MKRCVAVSILVGLAGLVGGSRAAVGQGAVEGDRKGPLAHALFPFCIDWYDSKKRSYEQQAMMLKQLGYDGAGHIWLDGVAERLKTLDAVGLRLYQVTMPIDITPGKPAYDPKFKEVLGLVKGRGVQFLLIVNGGKPSDPSADDRVAAVVREMSDLAKGSGAELLLYPHTGNVVERLEDAVRIADKVDRPDVGAMFNLCHWLRVDASRDYNALLKQAMHRLRAVSINGADEYDAGPGWSHYIQPLDRGTFDVGALIDALDQLGYRGTIGLQCYGIEGDVAEHLARSMAAWQAMRGLKAHAKAAGPR
ncbi:Xylose isomerase-like TIM barrel [Aquisphaera giovannonii]|uniref:Xylose isomerase-like TIM barrel n=1 Tax=Aquisphaera giovannonii TaxID=406548 RepID=A0A5B9WBI1_9BACT|nr:TIM barrel protein [Aquisphaera giovannonii]QEH38038.1 Xylose isomerase-like TIM barrel [Aquisphaera giovannonii]